MSRTLSMTGYGRGEATADGVTAAVEIRSVNHRFADIKLKLPSEWMALERDLTARIKARIGRGRLDVLVRRTTTDGGAGGLSLDDAILTRLVEEAERIGHATQGRIDSTLRLGDLLRVPGVLRTDEVSVDAAAEASAPLAALDAALAALLGMRASEGERLEADLRARVATIEEITGRIAELAEQQPAIFRARLERRMRDLLDGADVDEGRLLQEAAAVAAKASIEEEITRLRSHVAQARELLAEDGPVGRRLEFLVQEFGREANTVGSKSDDPRLVEQVIALKGAVEAIREQVANVE